MEYNPYKDLQNVYYSKVAYGNAKTASEKKTAQQIANKARETLASYGYQDLADSVSADGADAATAKKVMDTYAKTNKTPTRDYLYTLGKKYNMSESDVDKIISWDNDTGQVSLGGKVVGTPDAVVDGVSYWKDTSVLDNAFNDYINRSGTTASNSQLSSQNSAGVKNKIDQLWGIQVDDHSSLTSKYGQEYEDLKNTNPFETEEAKAILAKYDLAGLQGRDNAVASNAGSNGGNIDSFAAANALRQQAALVNQGQQVVLNSYQQKLDHAKSLLEGLGVYQQNQYSSMQDTIGLQQNEAQRLFENDETAKNNDVARKSEIASVTGYTPDEWVASNNPYLNDDGTIKDQYKDVDFSAVMAEAKANGNTKLYDYASAARFYKIYGDYAKYGKYDDGNYSLPTERKTEAVRQFDDTMDYNYALINSEEKMNTANNQNTLDQIITSANYGVSKVQQEQQKKSASNIDNAVKYINDAFKSSMSGKEADEDVIVKNASGKYGFNPNVKRTWWLDPVIKGILQNDSLTSDEMTKIFNQLGIDIESDVARVYKYLYE